MLCTMLAVCTEVVVHDTRGHVYTLCIMDVQTHGIGNANIIKSNKIVLTGIKNRLIQKPKPVRRKALIGSLEISKCAKKSVGFLCIYTS